MVYKRHISCMQICEYVKKTVLETVLYGFYGFSTSAWCGYFLSSLSFFFIVALGSNVQVPIFMSITFGLVCVYVC
jgi:hypothetical protein